MRYIGIDYGKKRVGIALSDIHGTMAFPREVLVNSPTLLNEIKDIITKEKVGEIVIGHSLSKQGVANPIQKDIDTFTDSLRETTQCIVHLEPEWYTTEEVYRTQGKTEHKDASSAAIILNQFLTRN